MDTNRPYVRLIITDVDGTLTDGRVAYYEDGSTSRTFDTMDGHGFWVAKQAGVNIVMVSRSNSPEILARANHLGVGCYMGVTDKLYVVKTISEFHGIDLSDICYLGNDVFDMDALAAVGYPGCPHDAHPLVKHYVSEQSYGFISSEKGGYGAFRNLVDHLMLHSWRGIRWGYPVPE